MGRLFYILFTLLIIGGVALAGSIHLDDVRHGSYSEVYDVPESRIIRAIALPDEETAVAVATLIARNIVAADKMESVCTLFDTDTETWIITFNPKSDEGYITLGEELSIALSASDCRVIKIWGDE